MMPKHRAGSAARCLAPHSQCLSARAARQPRHGAEPRAAPRPLRCPKPSLPTSFDSVFPTSEVHPGTGRGPQWSAKLHPSHRSLFGIGRTHLPHQLIEISMAANVLQTKTHFIGCIQHSRLPCLQFQHLPLLCLLWVKPSVIRSSQLDGIPCAAQPGYPSTGLSPTPGRKEDMDSFDTSTS